MWGREPIGGPFTLVDHNGNRRTDADFRGKLLLIYFGFTSCSDVCPTDLQSIAGAVDKLGPLGEAVQPLFITVNPEFDTPEQLKILCRAVSPPDDRTDRRWQADSRRHPRLQGLLRQDDAG